MPHFAACVTRWVVGVCFVDMCGLAVEIEWRIGSAGAMSDGS